MAADCNSCLLWAVVGLLVVYVLVDYWRRNRNLPPGPRGLPIIGYYLSLGNEPHIHFQDLAKTYGNVFSFRTVGGTPIIVLNDLENAKEVLVNRSGEFIGRPLQENLLSWVDDGMGIAQEEGQTWKEQRRFFAHSVKNFGFGTIQLERPIHQLIENMTNDIRKLDRKPFDPYLHVCHVACNVISQILFKKEFVKNNAEFMTIMEGIEKIVSFFTDSRLFLLGSFMKLMLKFSPFGVNAEKGKHRIKALTSTIVDDHVKKLDPKHPEDFVDACLCHMKELEEKGQLHSTSFTRERLVAISMDMFMEGTGSVSSSICSYLSELSQHTDIQQKAQEELDREVGRERIPSWADRAKLPYLRALIQEMYRTSALFLLSTPYSNFEETQINGYRIPKRSIIFANLYNLNHDPQLYPEPSKYDPEHFLDSSGKIIKKEGPFSFGIGKRSCIGEPLAQMEVFYIVAALLQNFTLYPAQEGKLLAIPRDRKM